MIDYTSKMRHMSESISWSLFNKMFTRRFDEDGRIAYYDAKKDTYIGELQLTEASKIKVPNTPPLEPLLEWLIKAKGVLEFENSFNFCTINFNYSH